MRDTLFSLKSSFRVPIIRSTKPSALSSLEVWVKVLISVLRCRTHLTCILPISRIERALGLPILLMAALPWHVDILVLIWFVTLAFALITNWLTVGLRTQTPDGYTTFGDITKRLVGLNTATNPPLGAGYETVFSIVKRIIIKQLGVDDNEVIPSARFVEDLGMG